MGHSFENRLSHAFTAELGCFDRWGLIYIQQGMGGELVHFLKQREVEQTKLHMTDRQQHQNAKFRALKMSFHSPATNSA